MKITFDDEFLAALSEWQWGDWSGSHGKDAAAQRLREAIKNIALPEIFTSCAESCFRKVDLSPKDLTRLLVDSELPESTSSWSIRSDVSEGIGGGPSDFHQSVVLQLTPKPQQVILNVSRLYSAPEFLKAIEARTDLRGIIELGDTEKEVILEVKDVCRANVWGLGKRINSSELLALLHEREFVEKGIDAEFLSREMKKQALYNGTPNWIRGNLADLVIDQMLNTVRTKMIDKVGIAETNKLMSKCFKLEPS